MLQNGEKMYHIKNDKRMIKSASLICESLADILSIKSYEEISITDICESKGIARTTFYRLFDTLDDVLLYQFDVLFENSLIKYNENNNPNSSFSKTIIEIAVNNKALVTAIVASGRGDLFSVCTKNKEKRILQNLNLQMTEKDCLYMTEILTQITFAVINIWVKNGYNESPEELYDIIKRQIKIIYKYI